MQSRGIKGAKRAPGWASGRLWGEGGRAGNDEIARLRPEGSFPLKPDQPTIHTTLPPWGIRFWSFEQQR